MTLSDRDEMAELALKRVRESGAEYGDIRLMQSMSQTISGEDRRIASVRDVADSGFGVKTGSRPPNGATLADCGSEHARIISRPCSAARW